MLTVLLGGARSGKSSLAVRLGQRHRGPVIYVATSPRIDGDDDLDMRISAHRAERPPHWTTVEEELDLADAVSGHDGLVIVDCLTVWLGNLVHHGRGDSEIDDANAAAIAAVRSRSGDTIVISNEVGSGIVPDHPLARSYRDQLGRLNQSWVAAADRALFLVAGRALALHDPDDLLV